MVVILNFDTHKSIYVVVAVCKTSINVVHVCLQRVHWLQCQKWQEFIYLWNRIC